MLSQNILHTLQAYILLATGAPSSNALRNEVANLYLQSGDFTQINALVDAHMEAQARTNEKGVIGIVQAVANNGFGLNLSDQEAQQLVADLNAQGIDSWSELFVYATTALDEKFSTTLDNRSEAANRFTDLLAEQNKDSDYAGPQAKQAAQEWIAGIGASEESLVAANAVTLDLIDSFNEGNVQGRAFDGYIAGATVFIDENGDSKQSPGEVSTITDALGNFQFDGAVPSGKLVVKGGTDISTNQPFTSTLSAPLGSATLSPLSALANQLLQRGQAENIVAAEDILFHSLGIPRVDLSYFDPIKVGLDPTAGIEAHNAALQLHAATAQISNLLLVGSELIREVEGATGNTMQSMTRALLGRMIEAEENGETIDLSDTQVLTGIIQTGVENSNITSNTDVPVGHVAAVLSEINTITQAAAENNSNTNMQTALSNIIKLQTLVQSQLIPEAVVALESGDLSIIVDEFVGDKLIDRVDEEPTGIHNGSTSVNDGDALTNRPDEPTNPPVNTGGPTLTNSFPLDDATAVTVGSNIVLTFNEDVAAGTGNIVISDGTDTRTIAVGDAQVNFSGNTVTINPTSDLNPNATYNVQMAGGVITDTAGNDYAGISDATTLNFSTPDTLVPTLSLSSPADDATAVAVGNNIVLAFNEDVAAGTGNIVISDGTDTRTIAVGDAQVNFSGNTVTINPTSDLNPNATYNVQMAGGVITDTAGNDYAGINNTTALNFSTPDTLAPTLSSSNPADDATAVAVGNNIVLAFNEDVAAGTGNIVISDGTDTRTIAVGDAQVNFSGNTVTINPTSDLNPNATYNVQMAGGVITDTAGNDYAGINNTTALNFSTPDTLAPTLSSSNPADDATAVAVGNNIVLTFNEDVAAGTGNIVISDGTDTRTIAVGDAQVNFSGNTVTINPTSDLNPNATYNVQMASGVITDTAGNDYAGINNTTTLNFSTPDTLAPTLSSSNPADDATAVAVGNNIVLTFNEDVAAGTGNIVISDGTDTRTIAVGDAQVSFSGNTVTINPTTDLNPNTTYNVQMASGVITDTVGNDYAGISDATTLNFSTPIAPVELSAVEQNGNNSGFVINGVGDSDQSGRSVSTAGDVNGDGLVDLIVGAYKDDPNGSDSGASFVVFGKTDGAAIELSNVETGAGGFVIDGVSAYDQSGRSVSTAGDVNGDGLADLIVGASNDDPNGISSGASFVVFGKTDGATIKLSDIEAGSGGFVINGVSASDNSGRSVSTAGDVNGDGLADLIVGARFDDPNGNNSGASFVVFGKTDGTTIELSDAEAGTGGFVINGVSVADQSGFSVSNAGDVNSDGLADLIVGASNDDPNGISSGASFVVFGKTNGIAIELSAIEAGAGGFVINGVSGADRSGISISSAGDVNGDGLADLIVGADRDDPNGSNSGTSFVVFGKANSAIMELSDVEAGTGGFVINGVSAGDNSGLSVSAVGDVNGDGLADLIVGALGDDPNGNYSGASFVVFGKTNGTAIELSDIESGTGGFIINGVSNYDGSGNSVSGAGDVNGDGFSDLIVGAYGDDPNGDTSGASFVVFGGQGSSATVGTSGNDTLTGDDSANQLVAGTGDDTLVGNGGADVLRGGAGDDILAVSDLTFASLDGGTGTDTLRFDTLLNADLGSIANSRLNSLEIIDLNNTGSSLTLTTDDILTIVGDEAGNDLRINGSNADSLNLSHTAFFDSATTEIIDTITYDIYTSSAALNLDETVRVLVQQNITVSGAAAAPIAPVELSAVEQNGNNKGFVINGVSRSDESGFSVSSAGDVNGDGLTDLIVGAFEDDPNGSNSGASFIVFGKMNGTTVELSDIEAGNGGFTINGVGASDFSGESVSSAGDVNGDGMADLIIGAKRDNPNGGDSGASFVVFGKVNGITVELSDIDAGNGGFAINGVGASDFSGESVSSAGDVNGDGLADLIVGAPADDPNGGNSGASFVVFGKSNGTAVELSDIDTGNGGFVINGASANDLSGRSVGNAGDVNGDGLADLIVGVYGDDPNGGASGASFVVFGKADNTVVELSDIDAGTGGFVINGVSAGDYSGRSVSSAGDVNGDGLADLIVGADQDDPNGSDSGASFVVFGKTDGTIVELSDVDVGTGGFVINGVSANDISGRSVSSAGDVNGDGLIDLIIGAYRDDPNNTNSGASFVVFGKTHGTVIELSDVEGGTGGFVINGVSVGDYSGRSVSNAGDVNGDGFSDLIIGANNDDPNGVTSGASFVVFGGQGSSATVGTGGNDTLTGDGSANQLVAGAGDDTLVGNGGVDVLRGGAGDDILAVSDLNFASLDGGTGTDTLRFDTLLNADLGSIANSRLNSLEIIDLNNTGSSLTLATDDILTIVGDEAGNDLRIHGGNTDSLDLGDTAFFNSAATETIDTVTYDIYQPSASLNLDETVRVLVQQNITVSGATSAPGAPIELSAIEQSTNNNGFVINGVSVSDNSGRSVSSAGDVNGDGLADLLVGAYRDDPNGSDSGASFVVFGKTNGTVIELSNINAGTGGFVINGVSADDRSGHSVSSAGDVNGDGLADLIVGAVFDDPNGSDSGASFVVFGKTNSTAIELSNVEAGTGGFVINGVSASDFSGRSVSTAGDVNGDGLTDLIVGANYDSPNASYISGASFVVFGKSNGAAVELSDVETGTGGFVINGVSAIDRSGYSVSTAGDVNGDGLADLIVGVHEDSPNGSASGASFVVFGKTNGTVIELSDVEETGTGGFVINGVSASNYSGRSVSTAGDVNGDGLTDLIVGANYDSPNGSASGASFVVFGKTNGTAVELSDVETGTGGFVVNGVSANDQSGRSVSTAGDVNGDGLADLIVGAKYDDPNGSNSGASFVVFGKSNGTAVELSDVETGTGGFVINGVARNDISGISVSSAGDVNGDGLADLIVGAYGDDPNGTSSGASFVVFGGKDSSATVGTSGNDTLTGDGSANQLVAGTGDDALTGNGGADVLRGGAGDDILAVSDLNFASLDGGTGTDTLRFDTLLNADLGSIANSRLNSLEIIDLNNTGSSLTLSTDDILTIVGDEARNDLRINGSNADSLDLSNTAFIDSATTEIIDAITYNIYTPSASSNLDESVRLLVQQDVSVSGASTPPVVPIELSVVEQNGNNGGFLINNASVGVFGYSIAVSSAGDVNGDGLADLIVGAYSDNTNGNNSGASFVVFGKTNGTVVEISNIEAGTGGFVINGIGIDDLSGYSVNSAGDVNGDGLADLIVGAYHDDPNGDNSGASFVVFGKTNGTAVELSNIETDDSGFVINGVSTSDNSGRSVSSAGDVNGDGLADLIVGAHGDDPNGLSSGASFVIFGKTNGTAVELSIIEAGTDGFVIKGVSAADNSGFSVSNAGDVNGDGLADLIVGARNDDPHGSNSGVSFVVFGKTNGTVVELSNIEAGSGGFVINGVSADDLSGHSVSSAGDVNGDGLADLIVGAHGDNPNGSGSGASFVVFGKTNGTMVELSNIEAGNGGFVINGVSGSDLSGRSVSSAGDVNGDGLEDLIVGARNDDPNGSNSGASFVVFGKINGTSVELSDIDAGTGGFVINGASASDRSGNSVSGAGDVNGDGFADLIVGAAFDSDPGNADSVVVFGGQGSSATVGTSGNDTLTGDNNANQLVAGAGNDTLIGNGGADVLRGGAGDDILTISDLSFASLDGGTGTDTLRLDAALNLDLRTLPDSTLASIEVIDLTSDSGNSTLSLNITDVLNLNEAQTSANTLVIHGNASDTVNFDDISNGQTGSWADAGGGVYEYTAGGIGIIGTVIIDTAVTVNII